MPAGTERPAVVLVHGLWMGGWACQPLKFFLQREGFEVLVFAYPSTRQPLSANMQRLARLVAALGGRPLHFVGHSLGGLLVLKYLSDHRPAALGRVVVLGSPYSGCHAAERLAQRPWGRALLGRSLPEWPTQRPARWELAADLGVIAGLRRLGLGRLVVPDVPLPNDGVVALAETEVPGAKARLVLPVSHSGMLVSRRVARAVAHFLRSGEFPRQPAREEA